MSADTKAAKAYAHKMLDEAFYKIGTIGKTMKNPIIKSHDDRMNLTIGWVIQDGTDEKTAQEVSLPNNFIHKLNCLLPPRNPMRNLNEN